jgi:predicted GH43/DUF377 family glycosyl hydrolase
MWTLIGLLACSKAPPSATDSAPSAQESPDGETGSGSAGDSAADSTPPGSSEDSSPEDPPPGDSAPGDSVPADSAPPSDTDAPVDPCGDASVLPSFAAPAAPALEPVSGSSYHGSDNIYAPDVVRVSDALCLMYYGAQGGDGHDRIYLATSTDCHHWVHWPDRDAPAPILEDSSANHVNDPSVVVVEGEWWMYYTVAATGEDDRVHLATSSDGFSWTARGMVIDVGADGEWDDFKVGRPAVVHRDGQFWVYYDGNDGSARHVGLATSKDGVSFTRHASNPLVLNSGAVDVERIADTWVLLEEGGDGTYAHTSADGLAWCDQGRIFGLTGGSWDAYGQVTPFVFTSDGASFDALLFGGASDACWCRNRIGLALPEGAAAPADPDEGCGACVADSDCTQACRDGGYGVDGFCANPGSADPAACCACVDG